MADILEVTLEEYWKTAVKPRGFQEFCDMFEAHQGPLGLWEMKVSDRYTGEVRKRIWAKNVITDNGATAMLKNTWNNAGSAIAIFDQIAIDANAGSTTLTAALAANTVGVTSISVAALPASIPSGTTITLGYGGAAPQNVTTSATASSGATTISVTSFTVNSTGFAIGANVVPVPTTSDNPSSESGAQYSGALPGGDFTFSGTGAGNRQVVISYTFNGGSFTAGNYTEAWTTNANPIVSNSTASHLITTSMPLNSNTNLTVTITEKV
jgi:hypothetical protein